MPATAQQAVRSLAFMLEEMEESASNVSAREAMTEQLEYMREELRDATAGIKGLQGLRDNQTSKWKQ